MNRNDPHLTPTQLLLHARQMTPQVTTPTGKLVTLAAPPAASARDKLCFLCGAKGLAVSRKDAIKQTFTDGPYAKQPDSEWVCTACAWALSDKALRNYSLFATPSRLLFPSRAEWRTLLIEPPPNVPYLGCLAVSGQKWLHFKARVGWDPDVWQVLLEERPVTLKPAVLASLLEPIEALYTTFTKEEILTSHYSSDRITKYGIAAWERRESQLYKIRGSRLFDLAVFIAQKGGNVSP